MRGQKGDRERAGGKAEDQGGDRGAEGTDGREGSGGAGAGALEGVGWEEKRGRGVEGAGAGEL